MPEIISADRLYNSMVECEDLAILSVKDLKADGILLTDYKDEDHSFEINEFGLNVFYFGYTWVSCNGEEYIIGDKSDYDYYLKHGKGLYEVE